MLALSLFQLNPLPCHFDQTLCPSVTAYWSGATLLVVARVAKRQLPFAHIVLTSQGTSPTRRKLATFTLLKDQLSPASTVLTCYMLHLLWQLVSHSQLLRLGQPLVGKQAIQEFPTCIFGSTSTAIYNNLSLSAGCCYSSTYGGITSLLSCLVHLMFTFFVG